MRYGRDRKLANAWARAQVTPFSLVAFSQHFFCHGITTLGNLPTSVFDPGCVFTTILQATTWIGEKSSVGMLVKCKHDQTSDVAIAPGCVPALQAQSNTDTTC